MSLAVSTNSLASQSITRVSALPEAIMLPSGEKDIVVIVELWATKFAIVAREFRLHTFMRRSALPEARRKSYS